MKKAVQCVGALIIRKMTVTVHYTHLQLVRIWAAHQHIHIVIGLENHRIGLLCKGNRLVGNTAGICHYEKIVATNFTGPSEHLRKRSPFRKFVQGNADCIANCLCGIVRDDEIAYTEAAHIVPAVFDKFQDSRSETCQFESSTEQSVSQDIRGPDRFVELLAVGREATNMIHVVVSDEDCAEIVYRKAMVGKNGF